MKKIFDFFFRKKSIDSPNITVGERDENGYAYIYSNGNRTNLRILLFDKEKIDKMYEKIKEGSNLLS
jgi:hypothetical protein